MMTPHATLINTAAKKTLRPIGLFQKGSSRLWLGDHGWWLDVVEFQPSGWTKGTYLNVSCMWLWNIRAHISFDVGDTRIAGLERFESEDQFEQTIENIATKARERVLHYRLLFPSIHAVSGFYLRQENLPSNGWPSFNAAIAHGLSGRSTSALNFFAKFISGLDLSVEWQSIAAKDAQYLASLVDHTGLFTRNIRDRVMQARSLLKLPVNEIDFSVSAHEPLSTPNQPTPCNKTTST